MPETLSCPQCGSQRLFKAGFRYLFDGTSVQRWLCRECSYRFSEKEPLRKDLSWQINTASTLPSKRQVCELLTEESKNLAATEAERQAVAGEETQTAQSGSIIEFAWKLKKRGLSDVTIRHRTYLLQYILRKGADLSNPDSVETMLATEKLTPAKKLLLVAAYRSFTRTKGIPWTPIKVRYQPKQPFIPLESELDQLIAGCGRKTATYLQVLKDTGARAGEVGKLRWTDIDEKTSTIKINNPEKGSNSRTVKVTSKTISMVNGLPKTYGEHVFNPRMLSIEGAFRSQRNRLALSQQNPRLKQIHLHTFRHWRATMEYRKTQNIIQVMQLLGHKNIQNTIIYTHLVNFESDEYNSATAKTIKEARGLVEAGFEYICEMEDVKLFRKRK